MSFHVGLQKAFAGKSSSSKRKRDSSESEEWNAFSLNLHAKNLLPATVAKRNIEKGNKAGAKGIKFRGKKGKANAARTMFRAYPKTAWPQLYWAKLPMKNLKTDQMEERWHPFCLPHEWLAMYMHDRQAILEAQPAPRLGRPWQRYATISLGPLVGLQKALSQLASMGMGCPSKAQSGRKV